MAVVASFLVWNSLSLYLIRFNTDDPPHQLFLCLVLAGVLALGVNVKWLQREDQACAYFGASNSLLRGLLAAAYARAACLHKSLRGLCSYYACSNAATALVWLAGALTFAHLSKYLFWAAVTLELPFTIGYLYILPERFMLPLHVDHFVERLGSFFVSVQAGCCGALLLRRGFDEACALACAGQYALLVLYKEVDTRRPEHHAMKRQREAGVAWAYLHLPLCLAASLLTAGVAALPYEYAAPEEGGGEGRGGERGAALACWGYAAAAMSVALLGLCHGDAQQCGSIARTALLLGSVAALAYAPVAAALAPLQGALALRLVACVMCGVAAAVLLVSRTQ